VSVCPSVTQDGSTMLMEAAKGGHFDIMSLLLDWPASSHAAVISDNTTASRPHKVALKSCSLELTVSLPHVLSGAL